MESSRFGYIVAQNNLVRARVSEKIVVLVTISTSFMLLDLRRHGSVSKRD